MVVQRRVRKQRNFLKILAVVLIVACVAGLVFVALSSALLQLF